MESKLSKFQLSSSEAKIFSPFGTLDTFLTGGNFSRQICPRGVTSSPYAKNVSFSVIFGEFEQFSSYSEHEKHIFQ